ncbi:MAG: hypothetical protein HYT70_02255 [Candidatus Aenigmarchaeota archaeon]|nr:hypothetical protein [Candidatus Aenigmarchaeota archaeon]
MKIGGLVSQIRKITGGTILAVELYFGALSGLGAYADINSPQIRDQYHSERLVEEEMRRLGVVNKRVNVRFINRSCDGILAPAYSEKIREGEYEITIYPCATASSVKHELYHIEDGHIDAYDKLPRFLWSVMDLIYYEPRAELYSIGLELKK